MIRADNQTRTAVNTDFAGALASSASTAYTALLPTADIMTALAVL